MFYSYDLKAFGEEIRRIRKRSGYSQTDVTEKTGINEDTLRKIEKGYVIPKYETIEILSAYFKYDLLRLLQTFRINRLFYDYYQLIDQILASNELKLLDEIITSFKETASNQALSAQLVNPTELQQFQLFIDGMKEFHGSSTDGYKNADFVTTHALKLTIKNFEAESFKKYHYNFFEARILLLLGLIKEKTNESDLSAEILLFILEYLLKGQIMDEEEQKLILKIYGNLSYNYHKADQHELALKFANEGIAYAVKNSNMHCLYLLLARKGIAHFLLGQDDYLDALHKSIQILEINNQIELAALYKKIIYEQYHITV